MSKPTTTYEWDIETLDANGDIEDHNHSDTIHPRKLAKNERLVLVRDVCGKFGVAQREWAYLENGKMPDFFADAYNRPCSKVPKRFKKEFATSIHA